MDLILHIGAHRTASTGFQHYMTRNARALRTLGTGFLGPADTRNGLLTGVVPMAGIMKPHQQLRRARARVAINLARQRQSGLDHLIISDENMMGAPRRNLRERALYPDIGLRLARFASVFGDRATRICLSIRSLDSYWASALAFSVARGHRLPAPGTLDALAQSPRGWRDVITDTACAFPGVEILVLPHELYAGRPERRLHLMTGQRDLPKTHARDWMNRAPCLTELRRILRDRGADPGRLPPGDGRWCPFDTIQTSLLRETYADDLFWLRAGADGLATLIEETGTVQTGAKPATTQMQRGQDHGIEDRRLA
jgi:hypothetical protein